MLSLVNLTLFTTILGGWQKIENKVHLSPAEADIGAELGNKVSIKLEIRRQKNEYIYKQSEPLIVLYSFFSSFFGSFRRWRLFNL